MLAQNFKTPTELGISEKGLAALTTVLGMLERGEINEPDFYMHDTGDLEFWKGGDCRTPACMCGWARHVAKDERLFQSAYQPRPQPLSNLFLMMADAQTCATVGIHKPPITTANAAIALRNYLTHGDPRWDEAFA